MPVGVVEVLEIVDVHHDHREHRRVALAALDLFFDARVEVTPHVEPGEPVDHRELVEVRVLQRRRDLQRECLEQPLVLVAERGRSHRLHGDHARALAVHHQRDTEPAAKAVVGGCRIVLATRLAFGHHPAGLALAFGHVRAKKALGVAIVAVDRELGLAARAAMHERDRVGLRDRVAHLARDRFDELFDLQRRAEPARRRVEDLGIADALGQLMARSGQPREHEVDEEIRQRQQHEPGGCAGS